MKEITRNENGYTFMELLSVLVVVSILAAIVAVNVNHSRRTVYDQVAKEQVASIEQGAQTCRELYGSFMKLRIEPTASRAIECDNGIEVQTLPEGIEATIEADPDTGKLQELEVLHKEGTAKFCRHVNNEWELFTVPQSEPCP